MNQAGALTLYMLGNFACFFVVWIFFFLIKFYNNKKKIRNTIRVLNSLDPDQFQTVCKGYQQTTKDATSWERVKD